MAKIFNILKCVQNVGVIPHFAPLHRSQCGFSSKCQKKLKIMFFGTDEFALQSLASLHKELLGGGCVQGLEVTCLAMKTLIPAVAKYATKNDIKMHCWPPDVGFIDQESFDLGVVASFGQLIPAKVISSFPLGMVNVHGSLLPRWRGAAPVIHALANGDKTTGVTIMRVRPKRFDVGEVFAMKQVEIGDHDRRPELTAQLARTGADLLTEVLRDFENFNKLARQQGVEGVSHAPLVKKEVACIDWENMSNFDVYNLWRAVGDMMKFRTKYSETGLTVRIGTVLHPSVLQGADLGDCQTPGVVRFVRRGKKKKYVCVKCRDGWVAISDIFYHNKKVMSPTDFYNGFLFKPGEHKLVRNK
eukprot:GFUD01023390.1.p1 GENE.GFUD01023390.1~~GFUD01023390.1.p1  ORF type:complete len:358 (-),score=78.21 GFUD01023390.1:16-1089(-)